MSYTLPFVTFRINSFIDKFQFVALNIRCGDNGGLQLDLRNISDGFERLFCDKLKEIQVRLKKRTLSLLIIRNKSPHSCPLIVLYCRFIVYNYHVNICYRLICPHRPPPFRCCINRKGSHTFTISLLLNAFQSPSSLLLQIIIV